MVFVAIIGIDTLVVEQPVLVVLVNNAQQVLYITRLLRLFRSQARQLYIDLLLLALDVATPDETVGQDRYVVDIEIEQTVALAIPSLALHYDLIHDGLVLWYVHLL